MSEEFDSNKCSVCGKNRISDMADYKWKSHFDWKYYNGLIYRFNVCPECRHKSLNEIIESLTKRVKERI